MTSSSMAGIVDVLSLEENSGQRICEYPLNFQICMLTVTRRYSDISLDSLAHPTIGLILQITVLLAERINV